MCCLAEVRVNINMVLSESSHHNDEEIRELWVELSPFKLSDLVECGIHGPRYLVWPLVCQCVKHISQRSNASCERNGGSRYVSWITGTIPPLVMVTSNFLSHLHVRNIALRKKLRTDGRMGAHDLGFRFIQLIGLQQNRVRYANLSDIVKTGGKIYHVASILLATKFMGEERG